jgi:hypothetical protein
LFVAQDITAIISLHRLQIMNSPRFSVAWPLLGVDETGALYDRFGIPDAGIGFTWN